MDIFCNFNRDTVDSSQIFFAIAQHEEDLIQFEEPPCFRDIKLPSFWSDRPASWFALAEARFRSHNIGGEQAKFDHMVGPLSKESIG